MPADPPRHERDEVVQAWELLKGRCCATPIGSANWPKVTTIMQVRQADLRFAMQHAIARLAQAERERDAAQAYTRSRDADIITLGDQVAQAERRAEEAWTKYLAARQDLRVQQDAEEASAHHIAEVIERHCKGHVGAYHAARAIKNQFVFVRRAAALAADAQGGRGDAT